MTRKIEGHGRYRLQDAVLRMRHNCLLMHRSKLFGLSIDTPERIRRFDFANFLSSAYAAHDTARAVLSKSNPEFCDQFIMSYKADEMLFYLKQSRNAEDHSYDGSGMGPFQGEMGTFDRQGEKLGVFARGPWGLRPIKAGRDNKVLPVPSTHRGSRLPDPLAPATMAAYCCTWWFQLHDSLVRGQYELPEPGLPELPDYQTAANTEGPAAPRPITPSGIGVFFRPG